MADIDLYNFSFSQVYELIKNEREQIKKDIVYLLFNCGRKTRTEIMEALSLNERDVYVPLIELATSRTVKMHYEKESEKYYYFLDLK